jgi:hypothetical protein
MSAWPLAISASQSSIRRGHARYCTNARYKAMATRPGQYGGHADRTRTVNPDRACLFGPRKSFWVSQPGVRCTGAPASAPGLAVKTAHPLS